MFRPAIGTLIVAATLGLAGQAAAEQPMSPVYRTGEATAAGPSHKRSTEGAHPVAPAGEGTAAQPAQAASAKPEKQIPAEKAVDANAADRGQVVATAPIPAPIPPPLPPQAAVEPETLPTPPAPAKEAAAPRRQHHVALRRYDAPSHYPVDYRHALPWAGGWAAPTSPHLGPNPYSPNGGD